MLTGLSLTCSLLSDLYVSHILWATLQQPSIRFADSQPNIWAKLKQPSPSLSRGICCRALAWIVFYVAVTHWRG